MGDPSPPVFLKLDDRHLCAASMETHVFEVLDAVGADRKDLLVTRGMTDLWQSLA